MAKQFSNDFDNQVFAIALTDSPMQSYTKMYPSSLLTILQKVFFSMDERKETEDSLFVFIEND